MANFIQNTDQAIADFEEIREAIEFKGGAVSKNTPTKDFAELIKTLRIDRVASNNETIPTVKIGTVIESNNGALGNYGGFNGSIADLVIDTYEVTPGAELFLCGTTWEHYNNADNARAGYYFSTDKIQAYTNFTKTISDPNNPDKTITVYYDPNAITDVANIHPNKIVIVPEGAKYLHICRYSLATDGIYQYITTKATNKRKYLAKGAIQDITVHRYVTAYGTTSKSLIYYSTGTSTNQQTFRTKVVNDNEKYDRIFFRYYMWTNDLEITNKFDCRILACDIPNDYEFSTFLPPDDVIVRSSDNLFINAFRDVNQRGSGRWVYYDNIISLDIHDLSDIRLMLHVIASSNCIFILDEVWLESEMPDPTTEISLDSLVATKNHTKYTPDASKGYEAIGEVYTDLPMQDIEITKNNFICTPDKGYEGISSIDVKIPMEELKATENNTTYEPSEGYEGFSSVTVEYTPKLYKPEKPFNMEGTYEIPDGYDGFDTLEIKDVVDTIYRIVPPYLTAHMSPFCTLSGRQYMKTNDVPAMTSSGYAEGYSRPIIISTKPEGTYYTSSYNTSQTFTNYSTFKYCNTTYYVNGQDYAMGGNSGNCELVLTSEYSDLSRYKDLGEYSGVNYMIALACMYFETKCQKEYKIKAFVEEKEITENGVYVPDEDQVYNKVTVNVPQTPKSFTTNLLPDSNIYDAVYVSDVSSATPSKIDIVNNQYYLETTTPNSYAIMRFDSLLQNYQQIKFFFKANSEAKFNLYYKIDDMEYDCSSLTMDSFDEWTTVIDSSTVHPEEKAINILEKTRGKSLFIALYNNNSTNTTISALIDKIQLLEFIDPKENIPFVYGENKFNFISWLPSLNRIYNGTVSYDAGNGEFTLTATNGDCYTTHNGWRIDLTENTVYELAWDHVGAEGRVHVFPNGQTSNGYMFHTQATSKRLLFRLQSGYSYIYIRFGVDTKDTKATYSNIRLREITNYDSNSDKITITQNGLYNPEEFNLTSFNQVLVDMPSERFGDKKAFKNKNILNNVTFTTTLPPTKTQDGRIEITIPEGLTDQWIYMAPITLKIGKLYKFTVKGFTGNGRLGFSSSSAYYPYQVDASVSGSFLDYQDVFGYQQLRPTGKEDIQYLYVIPPKHIDNTAYTTEVTRYLWYCSARANEVTSYKPSFTFEIKLQEGTVTDIRDLLMPEIFSITENGTYDIPEGYDAIGKIEVNVEGKDAAPKETSLLNPIGFQPTLNGTNTRGIDQFGYLYNTSMRNLYIPYPFVPTADEDWEFCIRFNSNNFSTTGNAYQVLFGSYNSWFGTPRAQLDKATKKIQCFYSTNGSSQTHEITLSTLIQDNTVYTLKHSYQAGLNWLSASLYDDRNALIETQRIVVSGPCYVNTTNTDANNISLGQICGSSAHYANEIGIDLTYGYIKVGTKYIWGKENGKAIGVPKINITKNGIYTPADYDADYIGEVRVSVDTGGASVLQTKDLDVFENKPDEYLPDEGYDAIEKINLTAKGKYISDNPLPWEKTVIPAFSEITSSTTFSNTSYTHTDKDGQQWIASCSSYHSRTSGPHCSKAFNGDHSLVKSDTDMSNRWSPGTGSYGGSVYAENTWIQIEMPFTKTFYGVKLMHEHATARTKANGWVLTGVIQIKNDKGEFINASPIIDFLNSTEKNPNYNTYFEETNVFFTQPYTTNTIRLQFVECSQNSTRKVLNSATYGTDFILDEMAVFEDLGLRIDKNGTYNNVLEKKLTIEVPHRLQELTIVDGGYYTLQIPEGYDGYGPINVHVPNTNTNRHYIMKDGLILDDNLSIGAWGYDGYIHRGTNNGLGICILNYSSAQHPYLRQYLPKEYARVGIKYTLMGVSSNANANMIYILNTILDTNTKYENGKPKNQYIESQKLMNSQPGLNNYPYWCGEDYIDIPEDDTKDYSLLLEVIYSYFVLTDVWLEKKFVEPITTNTDEKFLSFPAEKIIVKSSENVTMSY